MSLACGGGDVCFNGQTNLYEYNRETFKPEVEESIDQSQVRIVNEQGRFQKQLDWVPGGFAKQMQHCRSLASSQNICPRFIGALQTPHSAVKDLYNHELCSFRVSRFDVHQLTADPRVSGIVKLRVRSEKPATMVLILKSVPTLGELLTKLCLANLPTRKRTRRQWALSQV